MCPILPAPLSLNRPDPRVPLPILSISRAVRTAPKHIHSYPDPRATIPPFLFFPPSCIHATPLVPPRPVHRYHLIPPDWVAVCPVWHRAVLRRELQGVAEQGGAGAGAGEGDPEPDTGAAAGPGAPCVCGWRRVCARGAGREGLGGQRVEGGERKGRQDRAVSHAPFALLVVQSYCLLLLWSTSIRRSFQSVGQRPSDHHVRAVLKNQERDGPDAGTASVGFLCFTRLASVLTLYIIAARAMRSMLPHPATSRREKDSHARFGMSSSFFVPLHPSSAVGASSLLSHLRGRTRLTHLAVLLLLSVTTLSVLANLRHYLLSVPPPVLGTRRYDTAGWEGTSGLQLSSGLPLSLETTIERDPRIRELDHLIMVPGHAIWFGHDAARAEEDDDWVLEPMQRGGSVKTYVRHIEEGVQRAKEDPNSLLVLSG